MFPPFLILAIQCALIRLLDPMTDPPIVNFNVSNEKLPSPSSSRVHKNLPSISLSRQVAAELSALPMHVQPTQTISAWLATPLPVPVSASAQLGLSSKEVYSEAAFSQAADNANRSSAALRFSAESSLAAFYRARDADFSGMKEDADLFDWGSSVIKSRLAADASAEEVPISPAPQSKHHGGGDSVIATIRMSEVEGYETRKFGSSDDAAELPKLHSTSLSSLEASPNTAAPPLDSSSSNAAGFAPSTTSATGLSALGQTHFEGGIQPPLHQHSHVTDLRGLPPIIPPLYHHYMNAPPPPPPPLPSSTTSVISPVTSLLSLLSSQPHLWYDAAFQRTLATISASASNAAAPMPPANKIEPNNHVNFENLPSSVPAPVLVPIGQHAKAPTQDPRPSEPEGALSCGVSSSAVPMSHGHDLQAGADIPSPNVVSQPVRSRTLSSRLPPQTRQNRVLTRLTETANRNIDVSKAPISTKFRLFVREQQRRLSVPFVDRAATTLQRFVIQRLQYFKRLEFLTYVRARKLVAHMAEALLHEFVVVDFVPDLLIDIFAADAQQQRDYAATPSPRSQSINATLNQIITDVVHELSFDSIRLAISCNIDEILKHQKSSVSSEEIWDKVLDSITDETASSMVPAVVSVRFCV